MNRERRERRKRDERKKKEQKEKIRAMKRNKGRRSDHIHEAYAWKLNNSRSL